MTLRGKVALITGAASGIGLAITTEFLDNGIKGVLIADINAEKASKVSTELGKKFGNNRIHFFKTDVTNDNEFEDAFKAALEIFGNLDIVINNAGIGSEIVYKTLIDINFTGTVKGTLLGLKYLGKDQNGNGGTIINIASVAGLEATHIMPIYAATKGGVITLVKAWGHPYHCDRTGVRVMAICPGMTDTEILHNMDFPAEWNEEFLKVQCIHKTQKPEAVGYGALYLNENGDSGSVWIIEDSKLFKVTSPELEKSATFIKDLTPTY